MARRLTTNRQIDGFISKVIGEANHHAPGVAQIILPLSQAVRDRLNLAQDRIEIYERMGQMARTCWITLSGKRYAFSYNYDDQKIELRDKSIQGAIIHQFDSQSTAAAIRRVVNSM